MWRRFDGLSGEWPCGSMVDWSANALNHKFWVQIALLQSLGRPFSFCDTTTTADAADAADAGKGSADAVYAQGLTSAKGRLLVLINTKATPQTVTVPGASGKHAAVIDSAVGNEAAREVTLAANAIELGAFGERDRFAVDLSRCAAFSHPMALCSVLQPRCWCTGRMPPRSRGSRPSR